MLKIIIPLAGSSESFLSMGYSYPKPLIEINGRIMMDWVIENPMQISVPYNFIFIVREEDVIKYHIDNTLKLLSPSCEIVILKNQTKGGLCSVLMASDKLSKEDSLLILNSDQIIDIDFSEVHKFWVLNKVDAGIVTFDSVHPRWSYARIENGMVLESAEKNPISRSAIAGYFYFKNAFDFMESAFATIINDNHFDGDYYISPVLNQYILKSRKILNFSITGSKYHSFYSPQMIREFERV